MGVLARLFGTEQDSDDEVMLRRYRHLLDSAPRESIEQAHAEAFSALAEPERAAIYEELSRGSGTGERPLSSEPATLARSASRAEQRVPGTLENTLRAADDRGGFAGGLVDPVVDHVARSPLVSAFLPWNG
jgi:DNA-binding transcriptional ArsR family regulator